MDNVGAGLVPARYEAEEEMEVKDKIRETLINLLKLKPNEVRDDMKLCDGIGVDSTEMVEFVIVLEKVFGVKLAR